MYVVVGWSVMFPCKWVMEALCGFRLVIGAGNSG